MARSSTDRPSWLRRAGCRPATGSKSASCGLRSTSGSGARRTIGAGPADAERRLARRRGRSSSSREPVGRELETRRANGEPNRSRERRPHLRGGRLQVRSRDPRRVDLHGQIDGERTLSDASAWTIARAACVAVEPQARPAGQDDRRPPREPQRRVAVAPVDPRRDLVELVLERSVVRLRRRRDVGAEQAHADAAEPANRRRALALAQGRRDGAAPVDGDLELLAVSFQVRPPARKSTGRSATARERASSVLAAPRSGSCPPTETPATSTPAGSSRRRAGEREPEHADDECDRPDRDAVRCQSSRLAVAACDARLGYSPPGQASQCSRRVGESM